MGTVGGQEKGHPAYFFFPLGQSKPLLPNDSPIRMYLEAVLLGQ